MGFRTIDLDTKEGMEKYKKLKETKSVRKTFGDNGIENFAPRPEEEPKQDTNFTHQYEGKWETGELPTKQESDTKAPVVLQGVVTGVDQLRVRKKPDGDILYLISKNSIVKILEDHGTWFFVETTPGKTGYVMSQFIETTTTGG